MGLGNPTDEESIRPRGCTCRPCPAAKAVGIVGGRWQAQTGRPSGAVCVEFLVTMAKMSAVKSKESESGKLRIVDALNAIRIFAFSQSNLLKDVMEVEDNSID